MFVILIDTCANYPKSNIQLKGSINGIATVVDP